MASSTNQIKSSQNSQSKKSYKQYRVQRHRKIDIARFLEDMIENVLENIIFLKFNP